MTALVLLHELMNVYPGKAIKQALDLYLL